MSLAVDPPELTFVFYVLDGDAEPPLYSFEIHNQDTDRERTLFCRSGETGVFHFPDPVTDDNFERCEPSDTLRLAVAQAAEGTVPCGRVDRQLPAGVRRVCGGGCHTRRCVSAV